MGSGIVYVVHNNWIQNPDAKRGCKTYKIGITTESVSKRYYGLGLKMPSEFVCDFAYKFDDEQYIAVEKKLHKILNQLNVGGEWYDLNDDTLEGVHDVCTQNGGKLITDAIEKEIAGEKKQSGEPTKVLSDTESLRKEYWSKLIKYFNRQDASLKGKRTTTKPYLVNNIRPKVDILLGFDGESDNHLYCGLAIWGDNAKKAMFKLKEKQEIIQKEIGEILEWEDKYYEEDNGIYISVYKKGTIEEGERWEEFIKWHKKYAELFYKTFSDRVQNLEL
jgi:hypothetical protein